MAKQSCFEWFPAKGADLSSARAGNPLSYPVTERKSCGLVSEAQEESRRPVPRCGLVLVFLSLGKHLHLIHCTSSSALAVFALGSALLAPAARTSQHCS